MEISFITWAFFIAVILGLLALDLGFFHKEDRAIGFKESLWTSFFYLVIAVLYGLWVWYLKGLDSFSEYLTGYFVEKSLALDNIFLISLIFTTLSIPLKYQHRVLFWGILGVIVLRAIMIGLGVLILQNFGWILYIFAAFMIITGIKMFFMSNKQVDISENLLLIWMRKHLNITEKLHGHRFFVYQMDPKSQLKKIFVTPLFIALVMIEFVDLIFDVFRNLQDRCLVFEAGFTHTLLHVLKCGGDILFHFLSINCVERIVGPSVMPLNPLIGCDPKSRIRLKVPCQLMNVVVLGLILVEKALMCIECICLLTKFLDLS